MAGVELSCSENVAWQPASWSAATGYLVGRGAVGSRHDEPAAKLPALARR